MAVIPALLGSFALGAIGGFAGQRAKIKAQQEVAQGESFLRAADIMATVGEANYFTTPEVQKLFKRFGAEDLIGAYAQIAQAPFTQEQRATMLAGLQAKREQARAETAGAQTEQTRQQALGQVIEGAKPGAGEGPRAAVQAFEEASPATQAVISAPSAQARVQQEQVKAISERTATEERMSTADRQARLQIAGQELQARMADIEERRRTGVSAEDQTAFRREELAAIKERNRIFATEQEINREKLRKADDELVGRIATSLFGEGAPARASKIVADYFMGRRKDIPDDIAKLAGVDRTALLRAKELAGQGHQLRKEALQTFENIISATRGKGIKMTTAEKQSMINSANNQLREAYRLLVLSGLMDKDEADAMLNADMKVLVPAESWFGQEGIVSPGVGAGGTEGLSPEAVETLRRHREQLHPERPPD